MSSLVILGVAVPVLLLCVLFLVLGRAVARRPASTAGARTGLGWSRLALRWAGIVAGAAVALLVITADALGRGVLLAAPVFGLFVLAGTLAGELIVPAPTGETRRAGFRVRRAADYLPKVLGWTVAGAAVVLLGLSAATTLAASPDDLGRAGRALTCTFDGGGSSSHSPWPGSFYTVPMLILVLLGLILAAVVLRRVVRRPQPAGAADADDAARRASAQAVTAAGGLLVLVPLVGVTLTAGAGLAGVAGTCGRLWSEPVGYALPVVAGLAFLAACWCVAVLVLPPVGARASGAAAGSRR